MCSLVGETERFALLTATELSRDDGVRRALLRGHGTQLARLVAELDERGSDPKARAGAFRALAEKLGGRGP